MRSLLSPGRVVAPTLAALFLIASGAQAQTPIHAYEFNGNLLDALGGPAATNNGATVGANALTFGANEGPTLSGVLPVSVYSIEMRFSLDVVGSYRKLIDFKDRGPDTGLYNESGLLDFYNVIEGPAGSITANTLTHLVLTRSGTDVVTAYINGVQQLQVTDSGGIGTFTGANAIGHFFRDDLSTGGGEAASGVVDYIRVYNNPLTQGQVTTLFQNSGSPLVLPTSAPEPASLTLLGLALAGTVVARRVRKS